MQVVNYFKKSSWGLFLNLDDDFYNSLNDFLDDAYENKTIFPEEKNIFSAFNLIDPNEVKVVILGQDPYHQKNQAQGIAFSVPKK